MKKYLFLLTLLECTMMLQGMEERYPLKRQHGLSMEERPSKRQQVFSFFGHLKMLGKRKFDENFNLQASAVKPKQKTISTLCEQILRNTHLQTVLCKGVDRLPEELALVIDPTFILMRAVSSGRKERALDALRAGANPNAVYQEGDSIIMRAAFHTNIKQAEEIVKLLLAYEAIPSYGLLHLLYNAKDAEEREIIIEMLFKTVQNHGESLPDDLLQAHELFSVQKKLASTRL
jgi:hypothetical protein